MKSKKMKLLYAAPLAALFVLPSSVTADSFSGKLNGHGCAHAGTTCPVDRLDPHLVLEADFVLQKGDGDYYFLANLPRDVKVRNALAEVKVDGVLDSKYHMIDVNEFRVKKGGSYTLMWSKSMQRKEEAALEDGGVPFFLP